MARYEVKVCTTEDGAGLARAQMSAFWHDNHWRTLWNGIPLEQVIEWSTSRIPHNLTTDRSHRRQLKAVDCETGEIVGYARFVVPDNMTSMWKAAQVAEPTPADAKRFHQMWADSGWRPQDEGHESFSDPLKRKEDAIVKDKSYVSMPLLEIMEFSALTRDRGGLSSCASLPPRSWCCNSSRCKWA